MKKIWKNSLSQWEFTGIAENININELDYVEIHLYLYDENDVRLDIHILMKQIFLQIILLNGQFIHQLKVILITMKSK